MFGLDVLLVQVIIEHWIRVLEDERFLEVVVEEVDIILHGYGVVSVVLWVKYMNDIVCYLCLIHIQNAVLLKGNECYFLWFSLLFVCGFFEF